RDHHQPLLAVLPGVDAGHAPRAIRLQPARGPGLLDRLLCGDGRRLPHDRVPGQMAGGSWLVGPRGTDVDLPGLLALDRPERPGCRVARLLAAPGHAAGRRLRLPRPVPHLLRTHPGALGAADGTSHRHLELPHLDLHGDGPGADRPLDRPDWLLFPGHVPGRPAADAGLPGPAAALGRSNGRQTGPRADRPGLLNPRFSGDGPMPLPRWVLLFFLVFPGGVAAEGPRPAARSPREALAAFVLADPDLTIELFASEPEVISPVAIAWDEDGWLYAAEMTDYPTGGPAGRVRRLEDRDGDGRYEHATVFADGLPYPNSVLPCIGGVLVTAAPNIWFLRDHDGDGRADERRVVLTGFGWGNCQLRR